MYKVKLIKTKPTVNDLHTEVVIGDTQNLPHIGSSFIMTANVVHPDNPRYFLITPIVTHAFSVPGPLISYAFITEDDSEYKLEVIG